MIEIHVKKITITSFKDKIRESESNFQRGGAFRKSLFVGGGVKDLQEPEELEPSLEKVQNSNKTKYC